MYLVKSSAQSQSGITLIISLVILLLLTLIGVSSMKITNLQEKMAGNDRDRSLAFQAAEAALRAGERNLDALRLAGTSIQAFCNGAPNPTTGVVNVSTPGYFHQVLTTDNKTSVDTDPDAFCKPCSNACPPPSPPSTAVPNPAFSIYDAVTWTDANSITFDTGNTALGHQPRYFITYVETHVNPKSESNRYFSPIYSFIVTARGTGMQDGSEVILRSYAGGSTEFNNN